MPNISATGDRGPLPGVSYGAGTMSSSDIYPTHVGIGGITTQDRALPAFAEAAGRRQATTVSTANLEGLIGTPAGYLAVLLAGLGFLAWRHGKLL